MFVLYWLLGLVNLKFTLLIAYLYIIVFCFVKTIYTLFQKLYNSIDNSAEVLKDENEEVVEADEEDNFCKPEGLVHFVINDLSKINGSILSPPTHIRGLPW